MKYSTKFKIKNKKSNGYFLAVINLELKKSIGKDWEDLKEKEVVVLSLDGDLYYSYNGKGRPAWNSSGQIDMSLKKLGQEWNIPTNLKELLKIWQEWHLNDCVPGTKKQMLALKKADKSLLFAENYNKAVEYLKSIGLYEDRNYKYGSSWLCKKLDDEVILRLKRIFKIN